MRTTMLVIIVLIAGCAGEPSTAPPATRYVNSKGQQLVSAPIGAGGVVDTKRLLEAKKQGFTLVNADGEVLYCRSEMKLGSHIQRSTDAACLTAKQLDELHESTRASLQNYLPSASPFTPPKTK